MTENPKTVNVPHSARFGSVRDVEFVIQKLESYGIPCAVDKEMPLVVHYSVSHKRNETLDKLFTKWFVPKW